MTRTDAEKAVRERDPQEQIRQLIGALSFIHGYADSAAENPVIHTNDYHRAGYKLLAEKAQAAINNWREQRDEDVKAAYRKQVGESGRSVPQYNDPAGEQ